MSTTQFFVKDKDVIIFSFYETSNDYVIEFLKLHYYKVGGVSRFFQSLKVVRDVDSNVIPYQLKKISEGYRELSKKAFEEYYTAIKEKSKI